MSASADTGGVDRTVTGSASREIWQSGSEMCRSKKRTLEFGDEITKQSSGFHAI